MKYFENKYTRFQEIKKNVIQAVATLVTNANLKGFFDGKIYKGNTKVACVPGLNCYSCPGAIGSCPIGSLQAVIGSKKFSVSYYVIGIIILIGALFGRLVCGLLCPFGFVQDLLYKIPTPKFKIPAKLDRVLRYMKYLILLTFVILLPMFLVDAFGNGAPYFCKLICPAGTLGGALPLLAKNEGLRSTIGFLFFWKLSILIVVAALSIFTYRPFCKYICPAGTVEGALPLFVVNEGLRSAAGSLTVWKGLLAGSILLMSTFVFRPFCRFICPLGGIYGFFNRYALTGIAVDKNKCVHCGRCAAVCKSDVTLAGDKECISCGECVDVCPVHAVYKRKLIIRKVEERDNV